MSLNEAVIQSKSALFFLPACLSCQQVAKPPPSIGSDKTYQGGMSRVESIISVWPNGQLNLHTQLAVTETEPYCMRQC